MAKRSQKTKAKTRTQKSNANRQAINKVDNPHDKRFKELFGNKRTFLSLLRDCVKGEWVKDIDENSLRKSANSFILQDFSEKEADIVYEAILNGRKIIFYILLEMQSRVDYRMAYRLLLYVVEILRHYYNNADVDERDNKGFVFPVVFPIVFYSGSDTWTVPISINKMFDGYEQFGSYVLNFDYLLLDAKGFEKDKLMTYSSRLLAVILLLEKSKSDVEFYDSFRHSLTDVQTFDDEERRIFNLFIKIMDIAYGRDRSTGIFDVLDQNRFEEVDTMLCDVIENAKNEKEQIQLKAKLDVAKAMLLENSPIDFIIRVTKLSKEQIEAIEI